MAETLQFAGEFRLDACELISSSGITVDISKIIAEINIFEDIFSNALTGSIIITDTNNLIDNMPIIGQEYISLKITTPGLDGDDGFDFTKNVFCVYEMGGRTPATSNSEVIELKICSPELLRNHRVRISKSYEETADQIVKSIMENQKYINTKKNLYIEPTLGIRKILSPNFHPYHLIKQLTRESMSAKNDSPHYLFFENKNGFHFRSLQSLYDDGVQGEFHFGDKGIDESYTNSSDSGKLVQAYKRIINISTPSQNNSLFDIKGGMLGSKLIMHDIYNKRYNTSTFSYFDDHDKHRRLEKSSAPKYNNVLIDDENTVGSFTDSRIHLHPTSITEDDKDAQYIGVPDKDAQAAKAEQDRQNALYEGNPITIEGAEDANKDYMSNRADKWLLQRQQRIHELNSGMTINISVHGNTSLTVGQVIHVSLPVFGTDHENTKQSKHQSGLYLISKLRHTFEPPTRTHTVSLQATKDSYPINFEKKASGKEPTPGGTPTVYQISEGGPR